MVRAGQSACSCNVGGQGGASDEPQPGDWNRGAQDPAASSPLELNSLDPGKQEWPKWPLGVASFQSRALSDLCAAPAI